MFQQFVIVAFGIYRPGNWAPRLSVRAKEPSTRLCHFEHVAQFQGLYQVQIVSSAMVVQA